MTDGVVDGRTSMENCSKILPEMVNSGVPFEPFELLGLVGWWLGDFQ